MFKIFLISLFLSASALAQVERIDNTKFFLAEKGSYQIRIEGYGEGNMSIFLNGNSIPCEPRDAIINVKEDHSILQILFHSSGNGQSSSACDHLYIRKIF